MKPIKSIDREYKRWLFLCEQILGSQSTFGSDLERVGTSFFGHKFKGVFPSDRIPSLKRDQCCIVNLDPSGMPGSHWVALTSTLLYDSFGRPGSEILSASNINQIDTDPDAEQNDDEDNCGARSMAFLCCYYLFGPSEAIKI